MSRISSRPRALKTACRLLGAAALILGFLRPIPLPVQAQQPAPKADAPAAAKADADPDDKVIREQSIYIPYEKLRKVFETEGRGVFLPYEKFQELWQAARKKLRPVVDEKPPVGALITEIENEATVAKDVVSVRAVLKIELLSEGWNQVPLRLADAAITKATLDGKPARIVADGPAGYKLLVQSEGKEPKQIELSLEYSKAITRAPGQNSVSFQAPQAPVNRWHVTIPEAGVKVNLHPMIAAPEVPTEGEAPKPAPVAKPDDDAKPAPKPEKTTVLAYVGAAPTVRVEWTPKAEGATGLAALASVQAQQQVSVGEGVTRTRTQLAYAIRRAELGRLLIDVPVGQKVVNVFDPNVRQWSVQKAAKDAKQQRIEVQLFEPAKGSQKLTVELEQFSGDDTRVALEVPVVRAVDAGRQQGVVVVQVGQGLRAETTETGGLLQVDATELPPELRRAKWAFSYRYASVPFVLKLDVEKVEPRILADSLVEAVLRPEELSLDVATAFTVERAGVFQLELDVPKGFDVRKVEGIALPGAAPVQVEGHHLQGEDKTRLVVNLARKAFGKVGLLVRLHKDLDHPELDSPTGKSVDLPLPLPRVAAETAQRATGRMLVYAPESLRVNPGKVEGLRSISFAEALEGMQPGSRQQASAGTRPVLSYAFTQQPADLVLSAQRRKPQVTVRQLLVVRIEEGVVKYQASFFYNVLYSGVKALRIDVPADVAAKLRNNSASAGIQDKVISPPPEDLAEGYVAWSFSGENELLGAGRIDLAWEDTLKKLEIGQPLALPIPRLVPNQVDRAWGQIVLTKAETIDIHEQGEPKGLRPIDPQHDLESGTTVSGGARAFEFHEDWSLVVEATRYQLEEIKRTSIERAVLQMVVTRAGQINVQALYRMRSARQRLAVALPAGARFDTQPLRINGRAVALESGDAKQGQYFVPLVDPNPDRPFLLELRYTVPVEGRLRLDLPEFPSEPAVQKVYLMAYLPEEMALLGTKGPWTDEFHWWLDPSLHWVALPNYDGRNRVRWATDGVSISGDPAASFQTDGRLWAFSTLSPEPAPAGALVLRTADETAVNATLFILVLLGGLLLLPAGKATRAMAIGALLIALVACGVFSPIFAMQIVDFQLAAALFIVLVVWVVWFFARRRPRKEGGATSEPPPSPPDGPETALNLDVPTATDSDIKKEAKPVKPEIVEDRTEPESNDSGETTPDDDASDAHSDEGGKNDA